MILLLGVSNQRVRLTNILGQCENEFYEINKRGICPPKAECRDLNKMLGLCPEPWTKTSEQCSEKAAWGIMAKM